MTPVRIVLVEPREAGNVGAAARAMKNFGFTDLTLVGTPPGPLDAASEWWASGAEDLVESARRVETLSEALADVRLAIATSSTRGRASGEVRDVREVPGMVRALPESSRVAIVFGRERSGLTTGEQSLCHEVMKIPTSPSFPVMNLAQAVALVCWEMARAAEGEDAAASPVEQEDPPATHAEVERLHEAAQRFLLEIGFLNPQNPEAIYRELRSMLSRRRPSAREVTLLLGILRQAEWRRSS
jgi:tRNA (cytidine32/uridine32-2'-O)-methyltransferase